jgi:hypothetical protein
LTNGVISGTPTSSQVGKISFTILISSLSQSVEREFFVYINTDPDNSIIIDDSAFVDGVFVANVERDEPVSAKLPVSSG